MSYAIQTEALGRVFGQTHALRDLTLQVPVGAVFGFLGPNGAGKTTTIRLLLGLLEPTSGHAEVLGFDTRTQADQVRARCGALLEHTGLYERLSAQDNLEYFGRIWRMDAAQRRTRIRELLEPLGLYERRHERVGQWSRGMKQKLAVARALLHRPALVFLDEPTAGMDPVATVSFREDLARLVRQDGTTVFLTTHNLAEAEKVCTHVGVVREGRLLEVGTTDTLRTGARAPLLEITGRGLDHRVAAALSAHPGVLEASAHAGRLLLRTEGSVAIGPLVALVTQAGGEVEDVRRDEGTLEEVYLQLMQGTEHPVGH